MGSVGKRTRAADSVGRAEKVLSVDDIGRRAASGAAFLTAKGALQQVLGFASTIVVARMLLPEQLGVFAIAMTISTFFWMLGGGQGMAAALIRRPDTPDHDDLRAYAAVQLAVMCALAAVVALATMPFGLVGQVTAVMVATAPLMAFRGPAWVVLERELRYQRLASAETAETVAYYAWTMVTVALGWGVWGLATATVVRALVGTSFTIALAGTGVVWPRLDLERIRSLLGIGVRVQAVELVAAARDQILVLGTAAIGSVSVVAYWSFILRLLQAPGMLLTAVCRVTFPAMSRVRSAGADPARMLPRLLPLTTIAAGVLLAPLAGSAPALVPLVFGDRWSPAADALPLACLALTIHQPLVISGQTYLWAHGDAKSPFRAIVADAVVFTAVALPLVPSLGVFGLVIGLMAAATANAVVLAYAVQRKTDVRVFRLMSVPVVLWIVAVGVALACAESAGPIVLRAVFSCAVAIGLYILLLAITRRELLRELAQYAHPWIRRHLLRHRPVAVPATTN